MVRLKKRKPPPLKPPKPFILSGLGRALVWQDSIRGVYISIASLTADDFDRFKAWLKKARRWVVGK